jgi:exonuclease III
VFSKLALNNVKYGIGHSELDQEGRTITADVGEDSTFIWTYTPCSSLRSDPHRDTRRKEYDSCLREHVKRIQLERNRDTYVCGDHNIAPRNNDATRKFIEEKWPSCKQFERDAYKRLIEECKLTDAYLALHPNAGKEPKETDHFTWSSKDGGMRLDHTLACDSGMAKITACEIIKCTYGSDHRPVVFTRSTAAKHKKESDSAATASSRAAATATEDAATDAMYAMYNDTGLQDESNGATEPRVLDTGTRQPSAHAESEANTPQADNELKQIFQTLKQLPSWDSDEYITEEPTCIAHTASSGIKNMAIQFRRTDPRLKMMQQKLRHAAESHLTSLNADDIGTPTVLIPIGPKRVITEVLLDTGAKGMFMPTAVAKRLGLKITKKRITVTIGDNSSISSDGVARVPILIGSTELNEDVILLPDCPYDLIMGSQFFDKYGVDHLYTKREVTFAKLPTASPHRQYAEEVALPFTLLATPIESTATITIQPRASACIPVMPRIPDDRWDQMDEQARWGLTRGTDDAKPVSVAPGIMRICDRDDSRYNWVAVVNEGDKPVTVEKGETIATFRPLDMEAAEVLSVIKHDTEVSSATTDDGESKPQPTTMSTAELNEAIASKPHLQDLDLLNTAKGLSNEQLDDLKRLVLKHHRLWITTPKPVPTHLPKCDIELQGDFTSQGRTPKCNPHVRAHLRKVIEDKLQRDIIEPSNAANSSTVLLVPKPNGGIRFCIDYRALNKAIKGDAYALPSIMENLSSLGGNKFFSSLDMKEAFWNVPLTRRSQELTAFRTPDGLYMYKRMPMGLKTASAVFCRYIDHILGDLKGDNVLAYIDDLLVATPTYAEHLNLLEKLFAKLDTANLTLGAKKCALARDNATFLGHVVTTDGIAPDPTKAAAIEALTLPQSCKQLKSTLGTMGYYRKFILNYATVAEPLRKKGDAPEKWRKQADGSVAYTDEEKKAFFTLRDALKSDAILQHPDWDHPFELHTDASHKGLGAVLCQRIDGKERVIHYASRAIAKAEAHFSTWELECLAMIWATRLFRMYLYNTKFRIITDSRAAKALLEANDAAAGGRLLRWRLALQEFEFDVHHRKGTKNGNADGLSRSFIASEDPFGMGPTDVHPRTSLNTLDNDDIDAQPQQPAFFPPNDEEAHTLEEWKALQKGDPFCKKITAGITAGKTKVCRRYLLDTDGALYRRLSPKVGGHARTVLVAPANLRAYILNRYHTLPVTGHKGRDKTRKILSARYYWPNMHHDIDRWIRSCLVCRKRKATRMLRNGEAASVSEAKRKWQTVAIDLVEAGKTSIEQHSYILTVMCLFSRYTIATPLKSKKAKDVAEALFTHVFTVHGKPENILSDEGKEFINNGLAKLYHTWNIKPITTGGWRPWSNPVERYHRYLNASLTLLASEFGEDWTAYLQAAVFSYNSSVCESTGYSPYFLMYGNEPTLLEDVAMSHPHDKRDNDDINSITQRLAAAYKHVLKQQERAAAANRSRYKKGPHQVEYEANDQVLLWQPVQTKLLMPGSGNDDAIARKAPNKWTQRWTGPHTVKRKRSGKYNPRYDIIDSKNNKIVTDVKADKLHPYHPWSAALPSTSAPLDIDDRAFKVGQWCHAGSMFIIPLLPPWPFGVCKALETHEDGTIIYQVYQADSDQPYKPFMPMWWDGKKRYRASQKRNESDTPLTGELDGVTATQRDIIMHSFTLTDAGYLRKPVMQACREEPTIWWPKSKRKRDAS